MFCHAAKISRRVSALIKRRATRGPRGCKRSRAGKPRSTILPVPRRFSGMSHCARSARKKCSPITIGSMPRILASYDDQTFNLAILKRLQKRVVVLEGHTSVRITVRAEHVSVCEKACASIDVTAANRLEAQRLDSVEKLLPRLKLIDIRRRRPAHSFVDVTGIVQPVAQARMRFQSCSIGQVDSMRRDIINGGPSIVAGRRAGCEA